MRSAHEQLNDEAIGPTVADQPCIESRQGAVDDFLHVELDIPILALPTVMTGRSSVE